MTSPRWVLATATAAQVAVSLVTFGLPVIGPELAAEFGLSLPALGLVLSANVLGQGVMLIAAGRAVERYGGRSTTLLGTAVATVGILSAAFAPSLAVLVALLFVSGLGSATVPIAGMGSVFRVFARGGRAQALGVRQLGVPLAGMVGAFLMPALESTGGVRAALLFSGGVVALLGTTFGLTGASRSPGGVAGGFRSGALRRILRAPSMLRLLLVALIYIIVLQAALTYLVPSVRDQGLSTVWASAVFFAMQATAGGSRIVWGRIADRGQGTRRIRALVEVGWASAVGASIFAGLLGTGAVGILIGAVMFALGAMGWNALIYVSAAERGPRDAPAQSVAVAATVVFAIAAISSPAMGALAEAIGWMLFWLVCAGIMLIGALVASSIPDRQPPAEPA